MGGQQYVVEEEQVTPLTSTTEEPEEQIQPVTTEETVTKEQEPEVE